jgi:hypothetical protein
MLLALSLGFAIATVLRSNRDRKEIAVSHQQTDRCIAISHELANRLEQAQRSCGMEAQKAKPVIP